MLYSDNGTNFHAADKQLKKMIQDLDHANMQINLLKRGMNWIYNPLCQVLKEEHGNDL